ncbi:MAG: aminoacyl-tRNA hydrolase [Dissulfurispiraceae bacterium]
MWIITGLGNPGIKYGKTRHNVGFRVIEQLSVEYGIPWRERDAYSSAKGLIEEREAILLKPLAFMNRSGLAVKNILKKYYASAENLIVIHDDLDIATGLIRIRRNGSSGGHKGIESIIQEIGTRDFIHIKIGIGRDKEILPEKYVLSNFKSFEKDVITEAITKSVHAVVLIITKGIDKTMNEYNVKPKPLDPA